MIQTTEQLTYFVPEVGCDHCRAAITAEITRRAGALTVEVDLTRKRVTVAGERLDATAIRAAINEAGYDVVDAAPEGTP